jgi:hypothetical protein
VDWRYGGRGCPMQGHVFLMFEINGGGGEIRVLLRI